MPADGEMQAGVCRLGSAHHLRIGPLAVARRGVVVWWPRSEPRLWIHPCSQVNRNEEY
jgi:hypothetical protein